VSAASRLGTARRRPEVTPAASAARASGLVGLERPLPARLAKRTLDVVVASLLLLACTPIILILAAAIRLDSKGSVFFSQLRCGRSGRRFRLWKLRTMRPDAEQLLPELLPLNEMDGPVFKMRRDPRVTRVGRWVRRWSLDEIPQFWNVVRGDMSLVGPRPPTPREVIRYTTEQRERLSVTPGITGLWQVSGRNEIGFEEWVRLDLAYIRGWSLGLDLRILWRTLPAVLRRTGAS
jgi:exopolysaccharide biosynthesis polyprenyl glycosylphosphotransferase